MKLWACPHCGIVYDLDTLKISNTHGSYLVGNDTWLQCGVCFKRIKIGKTEL